MCCLLIHGKVLGHRGVHREVHLADRHGRMDRFHGLPTDLIHVEVPSEQAHMGGSLVRSYRVHRREVERAR